MNNEHPNFREESSPSRPGRREFLTAASAGLIAAPLLAGITLERMTRFETVGLEVITRFS